MNWMREKKIGSRNTANAENSTMKDRHLSFFSFVILSLSLSNTVEVVSAIEFHVSKEPRTRRILHQPLFPETSAPPPDTDSTPPVPESRPSPDSDIPFFHEYPSPTGPSPPSASNWTVQIPRATQPDKPTKKVAIAISVGIVTLGMLSGLAVYVYKHRAKQPGETQKLGGGNIQTQRLAEDSSVPPSFLYIGTVEPSRVSSNEGSEVNATNSSPYHKLNSIKRSDRYRPSPELQPLPPLTKPSGGNSLPEVSTSSSDEDEGSHNTAFHSPQASSSVSYEEGYYTPASRYSYLTNNSPGASARSTTSVPHSKRTSPKSRLSASSPDVRHAIIPSIKQGQPPPPLPPQLPPAMPPLVSDSTAQYYGFHGKKVTTCPPKKPRFPPPAPQLNMMLLQSKSSPSRQAAKTAGIPAPPAPPPPHRSLQSTSRKVGTTMNNVPTTSASVPRSLFPIQKPAAVIGTTKTSENVHTKFRSEDKLYIDGTEGTKPKLKPLHWDKVRATSDRATVWDKLKSSSFQLNEDMMETLLGCSSSNGMPKESTRKSVLPPMEQENTVLDPKKSQHMAILLRALNVTGDEVSEALLEGNPEDLGPELLETLVKMAPTKEEEIKLREYKLDISKLGYTERFLKVILNIPYAFKRVEAMLYRANFDAEVTYLRKSFQTLEAASEELKNSQLFLKLLEAVLRKGNRMNVGTNGGDARAFKLDTLLKLVDIKSTDGKTTLLHFVVQEIIKSESADCDSINGNDPKQMQSKIKEDEFRKQRLQVVAGLGRDLGDVKKVAGMDSNVLSSYISKLELGIDKVRLVLQYAHGNFFNSTKQFLKQAEEEIGRIKEHERNALCLVKEVTEYFHGNAVKEEAHPFRIFMIVKDFLASLDQVCKEVGSMHDTNIVGSTGSFRIAESSSLPILIRYNVQQDANSEDESSVSL